MAHDTIGVGADTMPISGVVLPTLSRTATVTSDDIGMTGVSNVAVVIDTSVVPGSAPSTTFSILGVIYPDGPNGAAVTWVLLTSVAVAAVNAKSAPLVLTVNQNMTPVANVTAQALVPDRIRVVATHGNANAVTYSVTVIAND